MHQLIITGLKDPDRRIMAIAALRRLTGWGLKQTMQQLDSLPLTLEPNYSLEEAMDLLTELGQSNLKVRLQEV